MDLLQTRAQFTEQPLTDKSGNGKALLVTSVLFLKLFIILIS